MFLVLAMKTMLMSLISGNSLLKIAREHSNCIYIIYWLVLDFRKDKIV